jgi:hypothetical protein
MDLTLNNALPEPIAVTLLVIDVLEQLNISYVVVGSLASTQHGTARSTFDSNLVVALPETAVSDLVSRLEGAFYIDEQMALSAIKQRSSFNLIHLETMFKVDLFIAKDDVFDHAQLNRRVARGVAENLDRNIFILSAEDTILAKLRWYRLGGEQSERQWRDVLGVVKVQGTQLDFEYMNEMAAILQVEDLLSRLLD